MAKPRIPNQRRANIEHKKRTERYVQLIQQLYDRVSQEAARLASMSGADPSKPFSFSDYPFAAQAARQLQSQLYNTVYAVIMSGTSEEWGESNLVQNLVAQKVLKAYTGTTKSGEEYTRYYQTNPDALKAFQKRKEGGMNLSDRVWNLSEEYRVELEDAISAAIAPGISAQELSREVRKYLNEPDLMFRRFRYKNENGEWKRKWKKRYTDEDGNVRFIDCDRDSYCNQWTGPGYYKSSAKNAMRLARTEINMAYRTAEQKRWEQFDFVVGYEVKTTQNGHHKEDICDRLAGKYPKDFKFTGWHPQCMCYCIPILKPEEEFWAYDPENPEQSENEITELPPNFREWVDENKDRIERAKERGTLPYFIRDNKAVVEEVMEGDPTVISTTRTSEESNITETRTATDASNVSEAEIKARTRLEENRRRVEEVTGYPCGEPMDFEQANEMRGNPNYKKGVKFRVNCQSSVLANEMRRRGFDVEAYGNTKQDWFMPSVLAKKPEIAFMDAKGELPVPKAIRFNGELLSSLDGEMKDTGRYHLRFRFANDGGHIITAERLPDGSLRIYDPQSGKVIKDFSEYATKVKSDSFEYYRVDNILVNPEVAKGAVKIAGSKGDAPRMQLPEIKEFLEKGWYGEEDFYSPKVSEILKALRDKGQKDKYMDSLLSNDEFAIDHIDKNGKRTILHPGHKIKDRYWEQTKGMAHTLNRSGRDVVFLPEHENISMADALIKIREIPRVVDFKYSASVKPNTLQQHLAEGFRQAGAVVLKLENMDAGQFKDTVDYMKRNNLPIGDMVIINSRNKIMELSIRDIESDRYKYKIKGFLR